MAFAPKPRGAKAERRRASRQAIARPAVFSENVPGSLLRRGDAIDISLSGLCLRTRCPAPVGARLEVELSPPCVGESNGRVVLVRGEVVRLTYTDASHALMGIRLSAMPGPPQTDVVPGESHEAMRALLGQVTAGLRGHGQGAPSPLAALETLRDALPVTAVFRAEEPAPVGAAGDRPKRRRYGLLLALLLLLLAALVGLLHRVWQDARLLPRREAAPMAAPPSERPPATDGAGPQLDAQAPEALLSEAQQRLATGQADWAQRRFAALALHPAARPMERFLGRLGEAQALLALEQPAAARAAAAQALSPEFAGVPPPWRRAAEALHATLSETPQSPGTQPEANAGGPDTAATPVQQNPSPEDAGLRALPPQPAAQAPEPEPALPPPPLPRAHPGAPVADEFTLCPVEGHHGTGEPAAREIPMEGIALVVSKEDYLMALYVDGALARTFPVGLGQGGSTPSGDFAIANKIRNPDWYNRGDVVPAGDPRNPLGNAWMGLGLNGQATPYGIHPTAEAGSIGASESRGCVRMRPADADMLFHLCPVGTPVIIRP